MLPDIGFHLTVSIRPLGRLALVLCVGLVPGRNVGSVRLIARHPRCRLVGAASGEQHGAEDNEIGQVPIHFFGPLHRHQGQQQYERCGAPDRYPPTLPRRPLPFSVFPAIALPPCL